jgi:hypothetical protein
MVDGGLSDVASIETGSPQGSVLSKGIERILCDQFVDYIESYGFSQVFRRFHSKVTDLTSSLDDIHLNVEKSLVLLDFSKAFDSMVHGLQIGLVASLVSSQMWRVLEWLVPKVVFFRLFCLLALLMTFVNRF